MSMLGASSASAAPVPVSAAEASGLTDIIVLRAPHVDGVQAAEIRDDSNTTFVRDMTLPGAEVVRAQPGQLDESLAELKSDPGVLFAEPNYRVYGADAPATGATTPAPDDVGLSTQWAASTIGLPDAWLKSAGAGVTIAETDSGVDFTNPDLIGHQATIAGETGGGKETNGVDDDWTSAWPSDFHFIDDWRGWDFLQNDNDPQDENSHGTHVAGIIAATGNNAVGGVGVAPDAKILNLRVLDANNAGTEDGIISAYTYACFHGARVVNSSLVSGSSSAMLNAVINSDGTDYGLGYLNCSNTLFIVAAGNASADVDTSAYYPCKLTYANILCVGNSQQGDTLGYLTNYGATTVDLFAPGTTIYSTTPGNTWAYKSGTSMASPMVAGVAALMLSLNPAYTTAQLKSTLMSTTDTVPALTGYAVAGRLNAAAAVNAAWNAAGQPAVTPWPASSSSGDPGTDPGDPGDGSDPGTGGGGSDPGTGGGGTPPTGGGGTPPASGSGGGGGGSTGGGGGGSAPKKDEPVTTPVISVPVPDPAPAPTLPAPSIPVAAATPAVAALQLTDAEGASAWTCTKARACATTLTVTVNKPTTTVVSLQRKTCTTKKGKQTCTYVSVQTKRYKTRAGQTQLAFNTTAMRKTPKATYRVRVYSGTSKNHTKSIYLPVRR
jgi:subtilisin family serine protease